MRLLKIASFQVLNVSIVVVLSGLLKCDQKCITKSTGDEQGSD